MTTKSAREYIAENHLKRVTSTSMAMPDLAPYNLRDGLSPFSTEIYRNETQWVALNIQDGIFRLWDERRFIEEKLQPVIDK